jgi:hypothetical protein
MEGDRSMTSCSECLTELSTSRLSDIRANSPVALHYKHCENCRRVADDLFQAEHRLATALAESRPWSSADVLAAQALHGSEKLRRRRIARWVRAGLASAAAIVFGIFMATRLEDDSPAPTVITEVVTLECISPRLASEIARAYLHSDRAAVFRPGDTDRIITLRGNMAEVMSARAQIVMLDQADKCSAGPREEVIVSPAPADAPVGPGATAPIPPVER